MNNDATRAKLLGALAELGQAYPEWRIGQMMANLAMAAGRPDVGGVWDLEDEEAVNASKLLLSRQSSPAATA